MAWEERNGRRYYYHKRRVNGRVVSDYVGAGPVAEIIAEYEAIEREKRQAESARIKQVLSADRELGRAVDAAGDMVRLMTNLTMLSTGQFYKNSRAWRKRSG